MIMKINKSLIFLTICLCVPIIYSQFLNENSNKNLKKKNNENPVESNFEKVTKFDSNIGDKIKEKNENKQTTENFKLNENLKNEENIKIIRNLDDSKIEKNNLKNHDFNVKKDTFEKNNENLDDDQENNFFSSINKLNFYFNENKNLEKEVATSKSSDISKENTNYLPIKEYIIDETNDYLENENKFDNNESDDKNKDENKDKNKLNYKNKSDKTSFEEALSFISVNNELDSIKLKEAIRLNYEDSEIYYLKFILKQSNGDNFGKFIEEAEKLSQRGNSRAQLYLGHLYATGIYVRPNQAKALLYYTISALQGNIYAQLALGYRYFFGIGVKENCQLALHYYKQVATRVKKNLSTFSNTMIERKRLFDESENPGTYNSLDPDMIQYYQVLAENGDMLAQIAIGQLHYQGIRGLKKDHKKALKFFYMAAKQGSPNAMAYIGKLFLEGSDEIEKDYSLSLEYFENAVEKNNAGGYSGLGLMYLYGKGVTKSYTKAFELFSLASKQGWVEAQYYIGYMYFNGYGVSIDLTKAFKYFFLAAQAGYVLAFYYLGIMQAQGLGTNKSCKNSVELFKNVAERGEWSKILMDAYTDFKNGKKLTSYIKYSFMAELGYEVAQSNAAILLDSQELKQNYNVNQSYNRAFMYWSRAASQGYLTARIKLGDYFYYGNGIDVDFELAASQYRLAERSGQALFNLGYMYEYGLGLKKDFHLAKRYYDLAAEASSEAFIPVLLAKIKLYTNYFIQDMEKSYLDYLTKGHYFSIQDWDVYFCAVLGVLLFFILYKRMLQRA